MSFSEKIKEIFDLNGIGSLLDDGVISSFERLHKLLVATNKEYNLTAITDEDEVIVKHFADCSKLSEMIPEGSKVIDVGCGAGFPTLPLAILRQDCSFTAIDSTGKKIEFVRLAARTIGLTNVEAINIRAEEYAVENREKFDVAVSRAVASLNILDELCLPLVKIGGIFIAMKGSKAEEELNEAKSGIAKLGGETKELIKSELKNNNSTAERVAIIVSKVRETNKEYPRNYSRICKKPL